MYKIKQNYIEIDVLDRRVKLMLLIRTSSIITRINRLFYIIQIETDRVRLGYSEKIDWDVVNR
jgi:hypothetical protein